MKLLLISLVTIFSFCKKDSNNNVKTDPVYTQYGTPYANVPATTDAIIYQVNLRAFSNNHDFKSVTAKLDEIKSRASDQKEEQQREWGKHKQSAHKGQEAPARAPEEVRGEADDEQSSGDFGHEISPGLGMGSR